MNELILKDKYGELTFNYKDEAFTDSRILAQGANIEHASVIKLITNHLEWYKLKLGEKTA